MSRRPTPAGSALLTAMLAVALVATLSAMALWQLWRQVQLQTVQHEGRQAQWLLLGAMDWARIALREDARTGAVDHMGEPWALPLQPTSLGRFVQLNRSEAALASPLRRDDDLWLSGLMRDAQARLNLNDVAKGQAHAVLAWKRLFQVLGLPEDQAHMALKQWEQARLPSATGPLIPQRIAQLSWLGLPSATIDQLAPHVAFLPASSPLNLNTATPEVLTAVTGLALAQTRRWAMERQAEPATSAEEAIQRLGLDTIDWPSDSLSVQTHWFEVHGQLTHPDLQLQINALVHRQDLSVRLQRLAFEPTDGNTGSRNAPGLSRMP